MQTAVFGDPRGTSTNSVGEIHRNLQQEYLRRLAQLVLAPKPGPYDAQSLARMELTDLGPRLNAAQNSRALDTVTRAHMLSMHNIIDQALSARIVLPISQPGTPNQ